MAKQSYGIPYTLDSSYMDMEITIQSKDGIGFRSLPIKNIMLVLFAVVSAMFMVSRTFISRGTLLHKAVFLVLWMALCALLLVSGKTKLLGIEKLLSVMSYFQPGGRYINTRSRSKAADFVNITGFVDVTEDGVIKYLDGSRGMLFDIVGNGSILLFEDHRNAIIDRVDTHYRKMRPGSTYHFVTIKQPQLVESQIEALDSKYSALTCEDADLTAVYRTNRYVLSNVIGSSFKSLHQYLLLQAPNDEELNLALNVLVSEVENSSLMFKRVVQLPVDDIAEFYQYMDGARKEFI